MTRQPGWPTHRPARLALCAGVLLGSVQAAEERAPASQPAAATRPAGVIESRQVGGEPDGIVQVAMPSTCNACHLRLQAHGCLVRADRTDRLGDLDGAPIKLMPVLRFEGRDDIGVGDGAEQAPAFTNANRHRDRQGPELLGETHRLASTTLLLLATAGLQGLDTLELRGVRLDDERLAEQVVAGVPRRDLANVARPPEVLDILEEDDLHGWSECTNRRGRPPRGPSSTR